MLKYSLISAAVLVLMTVPALAHVTACFSDVQMGIYFTVLSLVACFSLPSLLIGIATLLIRMKAEEYVPECLRVALMLLEFADRLSFYSSVTGSAIASCVSMLLDSYRHLDKQKLALEEGGKVLRYLEMAHGADWPGLSTLVSDLAILDLHASNTTKGREELKRARKLAERAYVERDDKRYFDLLLSSMERLASVECNLKNYSDAISEYRKSIDIRENKLGPVHWSVGVQLCRLAQVYMRFADYREAMVELARAQTILELCPGAYELQICLSTSMADAKRGMGEFCEAKSLALRALELANKHYPKQDARRLEVLDTLGNIHRDMGEYAEAETLFRQNMETTKRVSTAYSLEFSKCLKNYADLLRLMDRNREADNLEHRAEQINYKIRSV